MLWSRVQRDAADDDCCPNDIRRGDCFAKHEVREHESEYNARAFEHVGLTYIHSLDNLLPEYCVDSQYAHRAAQECYVSRREELPLRCKFREHP